MDRPNILLILTDQQSASAMSCAGNTWLRTAAMDRLADEGTRFERAYCTQPLCVPARMSLMTGRMPHETGIMFNCALAPLEVPMLGRLLGEAGYDTGYSGKWHLTVPYDATDLHGFQWMKHANLGARADLPKDADVPPSFAEFLARPRTQPFFFVASFLNPHDICQWARGEALPNGPIGEPPPPEDCPPLPGNFEAAPADDGFLREAQRARAFVWPTVDWPAERWRQYRWAYYRLIETVDAEIARVLEALDDAGRADDTLVVFVADHGDGHGGHRWSQKHALYDEVARVPLLVRAPGRAGGQVSEHLVSVGLDLLPTFCELGGAPVPTRCRGRSLRPVLDGGDNGREQLVCETQFGQREGPYGPGGRMLRTERYKYIRWSVGPQADDLYDLREDPLETRNLAAEAAASRPGPAAADALAEHRRRLDAWQRETADPFPAVPPQPHYEK